MTPEADHSATGQLTDMAEGAIWGAAGSVTMAGAAKKLIGCHSFLPGTGVLLADGTHRAIEDVQEGDDVVTTDVETGKTTTKDVASTITTIGDKDFTDITIRVGDDYSPPSPPQTLTRFGYQSSRNGYLREISRSVNGCTRARVSASRSQLYAATPSLSARTTSRSQTSTRTMC